MINKVILVGRITKDPELKNTNSGTYVVKFTLAVNRIVSASSEKKTDFINCTVFGKQAENLEKYISKGALIGVEGNIRVETWEKDGVTNWQTSVVCNNVQFLESKKNPDNAYDNF
ncbi:hypothetical protein HPP_2760 [Hydrangea phyllody phytoplasma]|uniref:Single-stranded DNA-binding protein n=10 Tax=Candidatus Phytoplasma TaxID=33926 RepID=A0A4P6MBP3_9MOLU|nr:MULTISPECIES: single-stranded DNA-binding protein [Phytoplasma]AIY62700.1 single-stranded DNA-binding protein ['Catharanthus roseus' stolbur phytoplasma]QKX95035.1 MAG: single-stranded DNA-binding protein [Rapeseed phyllody phytoplasma]BAD04095.1 single-stranded DNA-binding protein [Onion yellows phytoplasma OY-M]GLH61127.1 hypothetical protein RHYP_0720 [Rhus yellows phytoplasma]AOF54562.1 single-stranded DNA-binding protein [Maize bushy stunt phytoplasma]